MTSNLHQYSFQTRGYSKQDIVEWMESGDVKVRDSQPDRSAATHLDDQKKIAEPSHQISSTRCHQDEVSVQGSDSRVNVTYGIGNIRLEEYGIEVQIPPGEAYSAKDITVDVIEKVPPELLTVLKETGAIITVGLKMSPSDASFERPVKVTMPHCGVFRKPESAQIVTYYRKNGKIRIFVFLPLHADIKFNKLDKTYIRHIALNI
nr:uncharacterized protein LOC129279494 [Lytechinus pictus]